MTTKIILEVIKGQLKGKIFNFDERMTCIVGRSPKCNLRLPDDKAHAKASRYHCLLDINPPDIRIRDLGSLNGTYVNGQKIGQRPKNAKLKNKQSVQFFPEYDLRASDEIRIGETVFRIGVSMPGVCADCWEDIPEKDLELSKIEENVYRCEQCRIKFVTTDQLPVPICPRCKFCGKDVTGKVRRRGDYVCGTCSKKPESIIQKLLSDAEDGQTDLAALEGYTLKRMIGRGRIGAVYLAENQKTGVLSALKIMIPMVSVGKEARERFLREIMLTGGLKHNHVIRLYDYGYYKGIFFFLQEVGEGGSIADAMRASGGTLPVDTAVKFINQLSDGLTYIHNVDMVHRDIKPVNLLLTNDRETAKISDCGLSKAFDAAGLSGLSMTGDLMGSPQFMPRQQVINFKFARSEADVWALAASLYNMLTGAFPREFPTGKDPWSVIVTDQPVPILQRNNRLPEKLAAVIDTALVDKLEIAYKTAAELKTAIKEAL